MVVMVATEVDGELWISRYWRIKKKAVVEVEMDGERGS